MNATVLIDGKKIFLNPFMTTLIGNTVEAVARSLKAPDGKRIAFTLNYDQLQLEIDDQEVPLNLGHAQQIVGNILRGIVQSLKGAENGTEFRFVCEA